MYLDEYAAGGGYHGASCCACKEPIDTGERSMRVTFNNDPRGIKGMTGEYHLACARPFASVARIMNMNPWAR